MVRTRKKRIVGVAVMTESKGYSQLFNLLTAN